MLWQIIPSVQAHAIFNRWTKGATAMDDPLDERTLGQRRADLFMHVNLAEIDGEVAGFVPDEHDDFAFVHWYRGIQAEVFLEVPVMTLIGESDVPATLDGTVPIDPVTARILVSEAPGLTRVLTHPETGVVLSIGRERYRIPKPLRDWLRLRDLRCRFPGCNIPAHRCDIDHGIEWQDGGETNANNLGNLCTGHHTLKGNTLWTVEHAQDGSGVIKWTTPSGRTYIDYPYRPFAA